AYLDLANRALSGNVRVSPWIHVESQGTHWSAARVGEHLAMRGRVRGLFEKKGHQFVELDLLLVAQGSRPVASIRHTAIYQLRRAWRPSAHWRGSGAFLPILGRPSEVGFASRASRPVRTGR